MSKLNVIRGIALTLLSGLTVLCVVLMGPLGVHWQIITGIVPVMTMIEVEICLKESGGNKINGIS